MTETRTHRQWLTQVRRWKASGLSRGEYAAKAGLNPSTLGWWAWKLKAGAETKRHRRPAETVEVAPGLPVVEVVPATTTVTLVELELDGVTIRLPADFETGTLSRVLEALETRQ